MLDMGFIDDIRFLLKQLPPKRQVILFSATMPDEIGAIAKEFMSNPAEVRIAVSKPAEKIDQSIYVCRDTDKMAVVGHIFSHKLPERVILFASSKACVKEITALLKKRGFNCAQMHSDLSQKERDEVMLAFRQRKTGILVATDIVSRGIDIDDIQMVINYDCPRDPEDYVHRIGRTARAGREGNAVTLVGERDFIALRKIEKLLGGHIRRNPLPEGCHEAVERPKQSPRRASSNHRDKERKTKGATRKATDVQADGNTHGTHRPRHRKPTRNKEQGESSHHP